MDDLMELFRRVPSHVQDGVALLLDKPVLFFPIGVGLVVAIGATRWLVRNR